MNDCPHCKGLLRLESEQWVPSFKYVCWSCGLSGPRGITADEAKTNLCRLFVEEFKHAS